jgi:hypothetical protein
VSVHTAPTTGLRRPAWLLALSPLGFVVLIVAGSAMIPPGLFDEITPAALATFGGGWIAFHALLVLAIAWGCAGVALVGAALRRPLGTAAAAAAALAVLLEIGCAVVRSTMVTSTAPTLGQDGRAGTALLLSLLAVWVAYVATALCGLALRASGTLRRTGLIVAVLAVALLAVDIPTSGSIPPFAAALLWTTLGIGLLRRGTGG